MISLMLWKPSKPTTGPIHTSWKIATIAGAKNVEIMLFSRVLNQDKLFTCELSSLRAALKCFSRFLDLIFEKEFCSVILEFEYMIEVQ